jgi:uncharacterized protein (TIGR02001 family)
MKSHPFALAPAACVLLATSAGSVSTAFAQSPHSVSANLGAVSNYIWRGVSQTRDDPAIQGGLDYVHSSGFYAGTWASNIDWGTADPNYELDLYTGFGGSLNDDFSYKIGTIYYAYPDGRDLDFAEVGASATWKWFTLGLAYTVYGEADDAPFDDGDLYYHAGFELDDLPFGLAFSARGGYYDFHHDEIPVSVGTESFDYWHYGASISKEVGEFGTFSFNWDQNSGEEDIGYDNDPKIWIGWLKEF